MGRGTFIRAGSGCCGLGLVSSWARSGHRYMYACRLPPNLLCTMGCAWLTCYQPGGLMFLPPGLGTVNARSPFLIE